MKLSHLWFCFFLSGTIAANAQDKSLQKLFFDDTASLLPVFTKGVGIVSEGPAMSPGGLLFFADVALEKNSGAIRSYNPANGSTTVFRSPANGAGGLAFDANGNLLIAEGANFGGRKISRADIGTGSIAIVTDTFNGRPYNAPNDLTVDNHGTIYFTDSRYLGNEPLEQPFMGVYRIALDGSVRLVAANATRPNGIAISPDQKRLYVGNYDFPGPGVYGPLPNGFNGPVPKPCGDILVYDILPDGNLRFNKQLVHFEGGGPDGLKVDAEENIYVIVSNNLYVYSPQGKKQAELKIPIKDGFAANLCFGTGKYNKTLFITATRTLYMIETKKEGFHLKPETKK